MATRPIFIPAQSSDGLVLELPITLEWHSGFARIQKEKNIAALHDSAGKAGYSPILEVSSKSLALHGRKLSAFSVQVQTSLGQEITLECAFQGSKVFQRGGPYTDLYAVDPREARRDARLSSSGALTGFHFDGIEWPLLPKTAFYDWLYITFLYRWRTWAEKLSRYAAFSDIEFNPQRSINCQARSVALFVSLSQKKLLEQAVSSPAAFIQLLERSGYQSGAVSQPLM